MENEIIKIFKRNKFRHACIIVLFKGEMLPKYCTPMVRRPSPRINIPLNNNLSKIYFSAVRKNPSIKDGAILIQLGRGCPILKGFSYRLFPPPSKTPRLENKGSGYNSSLDFSLVKNVVCVYFINKNGVVKFVNGKEYKKFDLELYKDTHKYYVKYRPGIPEEVINIIVKHFDIKSSDRILDIGCGTGQVALAMEDKCREIVCLDPDPEMLNWAKKVTKNCRTKLTWLNYGSEDLGKIKKKLGTFKLATICRAFHWMDQEKTLKDLDPLIEGDGGVAIFGDKSLWRGEEEWQRVVKNVIQKFLGEERRAGKGKFKVSEEPWDVLLARSVFRFIKIHDVLIIRKWNVESIIGYLFSTSFAAPHFFGDQLEEFKKEVKNTLLSLNPEGKFQENAVWTIILGSKKPLIINK